AGRVVRSVSRRLPRRSSGTACATPVGRSTEPIEGSARTPRMPKQTGPEAARSFVLLPARAGPVSGGLRLCRVQLGFDLERNLLADDHAACFQGRVPRHAPVFAVDLGRGAEARNRDPPRRAFDTLELDLELDRACLVADR